jgi:DNA-binding FrmR family transcriptional regulator
MGKMHHDIKNKKLHRIKIIKGHVAAVEKMIENDEYCINVLHQSLAIQKALKKLDMEIMEHHLNHCVIDQSSKGNNEKVIKELIDIYNYKS